MKTLVVHPDDRTTDFLGNIYSNIDAVVIRGNVSPEFLREEIKRADRVFCLGHGSSEGLFSGGGFIIHDEEAELLRSKKHNIYIWCNADEFVTRHNLPSCFYTGMFISELLEAFIFNVQATAPEVQRSNNIFSACVKLALEYEADIPILNSVLREYKNYVGDVAAAPLYQFNRERFYSTEESTNIMAKNRKPGDFRVGDKVRKRNEEVIWKVKECINDNVFKLTDELEEKDLLAEVKDLILVKARKEIEIPYFNNAHDHKLETIPGAKNKVRF